ncbi:pseudouridine-5'-phosphatase-like protein, partial [Leptotrombidium deliense]
MSSVKVQPKLFKPVTHVVFDLDGTLIDTETCYMNAVNRVINPCGKELTWELKSRLVGTNFANQCDLIVKEFQLPMTGKEFQQQLHLTYLDLIKNVPFMPGAERIIQYFHSNNIPIGLCTASVTESFYIKVKHFGDFFKQGNYFDVIVIGGGDPEVSRNKPDPQPYL